MLLGSVFARRTLASRAARLGASWQPVSMAAAAVDPRVRAAAIEAVVRGSRVALRIFDSLAAVSMTKADDSPVTVADFSVQSVVMATLRERLGASVCVVGEENSRELCLPENKPLLDAVLAAVRHELDAPGLSAAEVCALIDSASHKGGQTGSFFALDPIDGTKGFLRRDQWAVCLGLVVDGAVSLGVLGCPNLPLELVGGPHPNEKRAAGADTTAARGALFVAEHGLGATRLNLAGEPASALALRTREPATPAATIVIESLAHTTGALSSAIVTGLEIAAPVLRMDSQCKYAVVAAGDASVYVRHIPSPEAIWDHAAGALLVAEAGGVVTDAKGATLDFGRGTHLLGNTGVLACAGARVHAQVVALVASRL